MDKEQVKYINSVLAGEVKLEERGEKEIVKSLQEWIEQRDKVAKELEKAEKALTELRNMHFAAESKITVLADVLCESRVEEQEEQEDLKEPKAPEADEV